MSTHQHGHYFHTSSVADDPSAITQDRPSLANDPKPLEKPALEQPNASISFASQEEKSKQPSIPCKSGCLPACPSSPPSRSMKPPMLSSPQWCVNLGLTILSHDICHLRKCQLVHQACKRNPANITKIAGGKASCKHHHLPHQCKQLTIWKLAGYLRNDDMHWALITVTDMQQGLENPSLTSCHNMPHMLAI